MKDLLDLAYKAPIPSKRKYGSKWKSLIPIIRVLREKGYTYKLVSQWLIEQDIKCTEGDVAQAYNRYTKDV